MPALEIRRDRMPVMLRKLAKAEENVRVARRLLAIANALDGSAAAAQLGGPLQRARHLDRWAVAHRDWRPASWPSFTPSCWRDPTPSRMGSALSRVRTWYGSAGSGSARPCIVRPWVVCCARSVSRDRRRAPAPAQ